MAKALREKETLESHDIDKIMAGEYKPLEEVPEGKES
jgi:ATP-dependent Zn protease